MLSVIPYLTRGFGVSKPGESIDHSLALHRLQRVGLWVEGRL